MTAITQENHFFGSFLKGLGSLFSLAPVPHFSESPAKTPEEISAEAWKMTGDSMYEVMGKMPPTIYPKSWFDEISPELLDVLLDEIVETEISYQDVKR